MITLPRHRTVADVMTTRVHVASPETPFKHLVRLIEDNRISAVPIVDHNGIPVGVVSESDLLFKERRGGVTPPPPPPPPRGGGHHKGKGDGGGAATAVAVPPATG